MSKCMDMMKYLAGIFLGFILTTIVPGKVVGLLNLNDYWIANIVGVLTMDIIMAAVIIGFGEKNVFAFSFKSFKKTFIIGGVMTVITAFYMITNLFKSVKEYGTPLTDTKTIALFLTLMMVSAGAREEIFTRGLLLTFFRKAFGNTKAAYLFAMALSSILFGGMHFSNLNGAVNRDAIYAQIIYAIGIGFFLAAVYIRTGNIWGNMVLHFLFDISLMVRPVIFGNRSDIDVLIGEWLGDGIILKSILITVVSVALGLYLVRDSKLDPIIERDNYEFAAA